MSLEIARLQRARVQVESTFGTAPANWTSAYDVRVAGNAVLRRNLEMLEDESVQQYVDARPDAHTGLKSCQVTLPAYLCSHGTPLTGSQAWTTYWLAVMLESVMGGLDVRTNMGSVASAGWTTSAGSVTSGTNLRQGGGIGVTPTGSSYQLRTLGTKATNALTTKIALAAAPAENDVVHGAATGYLADNPATSLQVLMMGAEADDQWEAYGLQGGIAISMERGRRPTITFNLRGASWLGVTGSTFAPVTAASLFGGAEPLVIGAGGNSELQVVAAAAAQARSLLHAGEIRVEPQIEYEPQETTAGVEGIVRWRRVRPGPTTVRGSFLTPFESKDWSTARDARTNWQLFMQLGATAGQTAAVDLPNLQIMDMEDAPQGRKRGQRVSFAADIDRICTWTNPPSELERSAFRLLLG